MKKTIVAITIILAVVFSGIAVANEYDTWVRLSTPDKFGTELFVKCDRYGNRVYLAYRTDLYYSDVSVAVAPGDCIKTSP